MKRFFEKIKGFALIMLVLTFVTTNTQYIHSVYSSYPTPGGADGGFYVMLECSTDEEMMAQIRANYYSASVIEEMLNMGRCLGYYETLKAEGWIPQDFVPTSMQTTSNNASTNTEIDQTISNPTVNDVATSAEPEKTYTDAEIEAAWKETSRTEATCTEAGVIKYKNSLTGKTKSEEIPTIDHDYEITEEIPATCTEDGNITYTCTMCGDSYSETVEKAEHNYVETSRTEASCTEDGEVLYVCTECENAYTDTLPATGHTKGDWEVTKEAGIFSKGEKVLKCTVCGEVLETATIPQTSPIPLAAVIAISVATVAGIVVGVFFLRKKTISNKKM